MITTVVGGVAWLVSLAACAWSVQWLYRREIRELKADHDIEVAAMATRHRAAVRSMEEAHREEVKYWETTVSEIRERSVDHARRAAEMRERAAGHARRADAIEEAVRQALAIATGEEGEQ